MATPDEPYRRLGGVISGPSSNATSSGGGLAIAQVEHEALIEVDEEGTRAAAATGGEMAVSRGPTAEVNRPLLCVIRDRKAGTYLFIGQVADPTIES